MLLAYNTYTVLQYAINYVVMQTPFFVFERCSAFLSPSSRINLFCPLRSYSMLTLLPASVLFGRITSSLKVEFRFFGRINQRVSFSCALKFERALLIRSCYGFEGRLVSSDTLN